VKFFLNKTIVLNPIKTILPFVVPLQNKGEHNRYGLVRHVYSVFSHLGTYT
jgi:hypothetical protein